MSTDLIVNVCKGTSVEPRPIIQYSLRLEKGR